MLETILSLLSAIGVALLVVVIFAAIIWAIISARQKAAAKKQRLINLGYTPVEPPPSGLVEGITALNQGRHVRRLKLQNVFERAITGG